MRPGSAGLIRFLGSFLSGGEAKPENLDFLNSAGPRESAATRLELEVCFGSSLGKRIEAALQCQEEITLRNIATKARRTLLRRIYRYAPLTSLRQTTSTAFALRLRPQNKPRGLSAAFIGTDGSGKTSLIDEVHKFLEPQYRNGHNQMHKLRPCFLPKSTASSIGRARATRQRTAKNPIVPSPPAGSVPPCAPLGMPQIASSIGPFASCPDAGVALYLQAGSRFGLCKVLRWNCLALSTLPLLGLWFS
jgi:hypothetical protein